MLMLQCDQFRFFFVSPGVATRSSATADEPRDALSVKILSTVETSCTGNQQQIAVMELLALQLIEL